VSNYKGIQLSSRITALPGHCRVAQRFERCADSPVFIGG